MTRKDYVVIAAAIHRTRMVVNIGPKKSAEYALKLAASDIAATMEQDNPRFDRARFLKACGIE